MLWRFLSLFLHTCHTLSSHILHTNCHHTLVTLSQTVASHTLFTDTRYTLSTLLEDIPNDDLMTLDIFLVPTALTLFWRSLSLPLPLSPPSLSLSIYLSISISLWKCISNYLSLSGITLQLYCFVRWDGCVDCLPRNTDNLIKTLDEKLIIPTTLYVACCMLRVN